MQTIQGDSNILKEKMNVSNDINNKLLQTRLVLKNIDNGYPYTHKFNNYLF